MNTVLKASIYICIMLDLLETKKQSCRVPNNIPLSPYGTEELLVLHIIIIQRFKDTLLHRKTLSPAATKAHTDWPIANHLEILDKLRNCTIRGSTVILFTLRGQGLIFFNFEGLASPTSPHKIWSPYLNYIFYVPNILSNILPGVLNWN